jgi:hypothetical protein
LQLLSGLFPSVAPVSLSGAVRCRLFGATYTVGAFLLSSLWETNCESVSEFRQFLTQGKTGLLKKLRTWVASGKSKD